MAGAPSSCRVLRAIVVYAAWSSPQSSSLGANDDCADGMLGGGSICAGCVLCYSLTSYALLLLRRKPRCVGKVGAAGCSVGSSGLDDWDTRHGFMVCTAERSSSA